MYAQEKAGAGEAAAEFIKAPDGSIDFGEITENQAATMRRQSGKIRLERGVQNKDGTGNGLVHIEARHGKEIRSAGYASVVDFVSAAAKHIDSIWKPGKTTQIVAVNAGNSGKVMFLELQQAKDDAGDYYRVNSAFPIAENYVARKKKNEGWEELWNRYPVSVSASGAAGFAGQTPNAGESAPTVSPQSGSNIAPVPDTGNTRDGEYTADTHKNLMKRINDGDISIDEFKSAFASLLKNKEPITAELTAMTKAEIFRQFPALEYRYKNEKKDKLVSAAYRAMLDDFVLADSISWAMGEKYEDVIQGYVDRTTDETIKQYAESIKKREAEDAQRASKELEGIQNPQTADDFKRLIATMAQEIGEGATFQQARMTLTPEQRARFDELEATRTRGDRKALADQQKTDVRAAAQTTDGQVIETKHTKTGEPLFVVKPSERVGADVYKQWNATAKRMGGWYSSYRGGGAVPGFQFKTRENADAFLSFIGGDAAQAQEAVQARRDTYADDKNQSAVDRLNEMADALEAKAEESLGRERQANTARRARFAARAEASANSDKAMAVTMRNIASAIDAGTAKFLDRVRQKAQIEMLDGFVRTAQYDMVRALYPADQEKHRGEKPVAEVADYATFPTYTAFRSDLARLGRAMLETDGTKKLGQRIMKVADDVSDAYLKFAKDNLHKVATFKTNAGGQAIFSTAREAEAVIERSGFKGTAIVLPFKRGQNIIIQSPSEAMKRGIWQGDNDKRITLSAELGAEIVEKTGKVNRYTNTITAPWQFESAYDKRKRLAAMGIETPAELRAALREFIELKDPPKEADKIKEMERAMIGRGNDGLDFFPTPASVADEMVSAADIQEGMSVLEPSAGMGHIAERIRNAGVDPDVIELSSGRRELLEAKGFNVVGQDFMADADENIQYDRIIMNPPFSDGRAAQHVQHAYDLLKPGGRLVAIVDEGVFFRSDKKTTEFREWLERMGATDEKLEGGSFLDPSLPVNTGVAARMLVIDKSEAQQPLQSRGQVGFDYGHTANGMESRLVDVLEGARSGLSSLLGKAIHVHYAADIPARVNLGDDALKSGSITRAYIDNADNTIHILADRIPREWNDSQLMGLVKHEVSVHALRMGRNDAEFQKILNQAERLRVAGNPAMQAARDRVPKGTNAAHVLEEQLGYFIEMNPKHGLAQQFMAWFRAMVRKIGTLVDPQNRMKVFAWASNLSEGDLIVMAHEALRNAPGAWNAESITGSPPVSQSTIDTIINRIDGARQAAGDARVSAVFAPSELPAEILAEAKAQGIPENEIHGVLHKGHAYIVRQNLKSEQDVEEVLAHEILGHGGVNALLGDGKGVVLLESFHRAGGVVGIRAIARRHGVLNELNQRIPAGELNDKQKIAVVDEMLALAQGKQGKLRQAALEWLGKIRNLLIAALDKAGLHGISARMERFDATETATMLRQMREAVIQGGDIGGHGVAFMTAWHGGQHDFDRFDSGKIGMGTGLQVYGHGLYFGSVREIGEHYRDKAIKESGKGRLYQVELAPSESELLDWDKPLSEQSETVKSSLESMLPADEIKRLDGEWRSITGEDLYTRLSANATKDNPRLGFGDGDKYASKQLHAAGVRGIRYLDGASRFTKKEPTHNYVIFDDADVSITAKYSRRIHGETPSVQDYIVPETPEFDGNMSGDLAYTPRSAVEKGIDQLPIRLTVGVAREAHRGFGINHIHDEITRDKSRDVPQYTDDTAENYARHVAMIAKNFKEIYREDDAIILRYLNEALVVKEKFDATSNEAFYSVTTLRPAEKNVWGDPVWVGRDYFPNDRLPQSRASTPSPDKDSRLPDRLPQRNQTEKFDITKQKESGQLKKPTVTIKKKRTFAMADIKESQSAGQASTPHTIDTLKSAINRAFPKVKKLADALLGTGKVRIITADQLPEGMRGAKYSKVHDVDGIKVIENPTREQAINLAARSEFNEIRGIIDPDSKSIFIFPAMDMLHGEAAGKLGLDYGKIQRTGGAFVVGQQDIANGYRMGLFSGERTTNTPMPDAHPDIYYSSNGRVLAYVVDGQITFVADNIDQKRDSVKGLLLHELGVHALQAGRTDAGFQAILKLFEGMKASNAKVQAAFNRVPKDTETHLITEEALGYFVEKNPDQPLAKRVIAWVKAHIRKLADGIKGADKLRFVQWANTLTDADILYMVTEATKRAPEMLAQANRAGTFMAEEDAATKARESFLATERAYGGKEAYQRAKDAGKTRLNYQQWVQVRTPEFKAWFGDWENDPDSASKVVDQDTGEPMVVYHGTDKDFTEFSGEAERLPWNSDGAGHYFSSEAGFASGFGDTVMPVFLNLRNPKPSENFEHTNVTKKHIETFAAKGVDGIHFDGEYITESGREHKGLDEWVAFSPAQIKSSADNSGTFDVNNPDIRYSRAEDALQSAYEIPNPNGRYSASRPIPDAALRTLRRAAASIESPGRGIYFTVEPEGRAVATVPKGVRVPERFSKFAKLHGLNLVVQRWTGAGYPRGTSGAAMPMENREAGAMYFGEMGNKHFDRTGKTRFSKADDTWDAPEPSRMDNLIYTLQDKHIDLKRVIESIKATGKQIGDDINAYLQEELFHGRTAKRTKNFTEHELQPLMEEMAKAGIPMADFEEYLWMRHAEERNAQIAKVNPDMPDGGAGVDTATGTERQPERRNDAFLRQLPIIPLRGNVLMHGRIICTHKALGRVLPHSKQNPTISVPGTFPLL